MNIPAYGKLVILGGDNGFAQVDGKLYAKTGGVKDDDGIDWVDFSPEYQWFRNGVAIEGATGEVYSLTEEDLGMQVSLLYRFKDRKGHTEALWANNPIQITDTHLTTLRVLYSFIQRRPPDIPGLIFWAKVLRKRAPEGAGMLRRGAALAWVITKFVNSKKFKEEAAGAG